VEVHRGSGHVGDAFHVAEQVIEEREAAQFPVVDHVEPAALLHRDGLVDRAVLDPLEFLVAHPPGRQRGPRLREVTRTQQRSDHVGVVRHRLPPVLLGNPRYLQYTRRGRRERAAQDRFSRLGGGHNLDGAAPRAEHN
jgi:rhodanese-related sulfurtransferase